jgi:membrane-associated phospholipid phosphatase
MPGWKNTIAGLVILLLGGCAANGRQPVLGAGGGWSPGWARVGQAAAGAARDPAVWGPLLGAALLQIGDADRTLSDRLREDTPLFGSTTAAEQASDDWRDATGWLWVGSALLAPGPGRAGDWLSLKSRLLLQQWLAAKTARGLTSGLKSLTGRERPNGLNDRSFPSGHATTASAQARLACYNLTQAGHPDAALAAGLCRTGQVAALATGWARVEAGMHYPSDVLAGWAIGRFLTRTAEAWFDDDPASPMVGLNLYRNEWEVSFRWQF